MGGGRGALSVLLVFQVHFDGVSVWTPHTQLQGSPGAAAVLSSARCLGDAFSEALMLQSRLTAEQPVRNQ